MQYVIGGSVSTDEIHLPDGRVFCNVPGGAGVYALAGVGLWTGEVEIASGIGPAYLDRHGDWYRKNQLSTKGLAVRVRQTPTTRITYNPDGSRLDQPDTGLTQFRELDPTTQEIGSLCGEETKGVYVFKHWDPAFFASLVALKKQWGFSLLWEIAEDAAIPENRAAIEGLLAHIDVFSLNQKEARQLYGCSDLKQAAHRLSQACAGWIYLRRGSQGALLYGNGTWSDCPIQQGASAVDVTGAGNSSSGAVLYAYCEGHSPALAAAMGSVAAGYCIAQYGPPLITGGGREKALKEAKQLSLQVNTWE